MFSGKLKQLWLIFLCLRWVSLIVSSIFQSFEHILYILYCVDSTKVSLCVFVCSGQAGRGGDRPLGRCRLQYLQSHRPLRLHAVSPYFYLLVAEISVCFWPDMFLFLFPSSEEELPAPTAHEEKVKTEMSRAKWVSVLWTETWVDFKCYSSGLSVVFCSPASVSLPAKAAGDRASREVAEDGEEVG